MNRTTGRLLALLLLLLLVGGIGILLATPLLITSRGYQESIADLRFRLDRYQRAAARIPQLKTRLEQLQKQQREGDELLQGDSAAIAGAALQERLKEIIQKAGGRLESTQLLAESGDGTMERIAALARFSGTMEALQKALYRIEYGRPILLVQRLEIRRMKRRSRMRRNRKRSAETEVPVQLRVTLEVAGYRHRREDR